MKISLHLTVESLEDVYEAFDALCAAEDMFINEKQHIQEEEQQPVHEEEFKVCMRRGRHSGTLQPEEAKVKIGEKMSGRVWYNDGKVNVRRYVQPGPQWSKGQLRHS